MVWVKTNNFLKNKDKPIFLQKKFILRFITIFFPVSILMSIAAIWISSERNAHIKDVIMARETGIVRLGCSYLEEQLLDISQDVLFIASQFRIVDDANHGIDVDHIAKAWDSFSTVKRKYPQIRFLDMSGMERIRVNYSNSTSEIVSRDKLQNKSERYYFKDSLSLNPNEIYVSPFDLNIEYGNLEIPYKPVLRFATPVVNKQGDKSGIVVINYSGKNLLTRFSEIIKEKTNHGLWLVNKQGYWLKGPSEDFEWGFMTGDYNKTLAILYPDAWNEISMSVDGQFYNDDGLWTFSTVYPLEEGNISSIGSNQVFKPSRSKVQSKEYYWKVISFIPSREYILLFDDNVYDFDIVMLLTVLILLCFIGTWCLAYPHVKVKNLSKRLQSRVDELHEATTALQASERLNFTTLHSIGDAVISTDLNGCVLLMNFVAEELTGWTKKDAVGKPLKEVFNIKSEQTGLFVKSPVDEVLATGRVVELANHTVLVGKDGLHEIPIADSAAPIIGRDGNLTGVVLVFRDQTAEREMQKMLEKSEAHFRSLFTNMPEGFALLEVIRDNQCETIDYKVIQVNPEMERILGRKSDEMIGKSLFELEPNISEKWRNFYFKASKGSETFEHEGYSSRFGGYYRTKAFSPAPNYVALIFDNVTERMDTLNKLEESKQLLRTIIDTLPIRVFWKDRNLKYLGANISFAEDAGIKDPSDIVGRSDYDMFRSKSDIEFYRSVDSSVMKRKTAKLNFEEFQTHQDGIVHDLITNKLPLLDSSGECIGVLGTYEDVTDYNRTKRRLQQLSLAVEHLPDAVVITDPDGNIEYVNSAFSFITGYELKEAIGKTPRILKSGEHSDEFYEELWKTILSGEVWSGHFRNKRKDGKLYDDETTISSLKNDDGAITNYVAIKRDITNELLLEEKLQQANKMESIGVLAGGIAHQFNNLLQTILGHNELLSFEVKGSTRGLMSVMQIKTSAMRAAELTKELLTFSKKDFMNLTELDINNLIVSIAEDVLSHFSQKIKVNFRLSSDVGNIMGDERHIQLLFENIIENAAEAMADGGLLTVETYNTEFSKEYSEDFLNIISGNFVCCSISDTGRGMSDEVKDRIFEPFYSTKDLGAGLGLASAYGIIQKHKGWIDVVSEVGVGSTFKVYISTEIC